MNLPVTNTEHCVRFHALGDFTKRDEFRAGYWISSPHFRTIQDISDESQDLLTMSGVGLCRP